jgi:hypothetical protein
MDTAEGQMRPTVPRVETSVEDRWAAWEARGAAHDRAVRRKLTIAVPTVAVVAGVLYVLLFLNG